MNNPNGQTLTPNPGSRRSPSAVIRCGSRGRGCWLFALLFGAAPLSACADAESPKARLVVVDEGGSERTLELAALRSALTVKDIAIEDPNYGERRRYRAVSLLEVLQMGFELKRNEWRGNQFVFKAADGYAVHAAGETVAEPGGYLAFKDLGAANWEPIGPHRVSPGPFYVVWSGPGQRDQKRYPWPYGLARIEQVDLRRSYGKTFPDHAPDDRLAWEGHRVFLRDCIRCHAMNRQGGRLGPELNLPRNILEYRSEDDVRAFIRDPATFRYGNMPAMPHLAESDLDALIRYFGRMNSRH